MNPETEYLNAVQRFQDLLACIGGSDDPRKATLILKIMEARQELDATYTKIFHKDETINPLRDQNFPSYAHLWPGGKLPEDKT
jgi:hypothetical protein